MTYTILGVNSHLSKIMGIFFFKIIRGVGQIQIHNFFLLLMYPKLEPKQKSNK